LAAKTFFQFTFRMWLRVKAFYTVADVPRSRAVIFITEDTRETIFFFNACPWLFIEEMRSPSRTPWSPNEAPLQPFIFA